MSCRDRAVLRSKDYGAQATKKARVLGGGGMIAPPIAPKAAAVGGGGGGGRNGGNTKAVPPEMRVCPGMANPGDHKLCFVVHM